MKSWCHSKFKKLSTFQKTQNMKLVLVLVLLVLLVIVQIWTILKLLSVFFLEIQQNQIKFLSNKKTSSLFLSSNCSHGNTFMTSFIDIFPINNQISSFFPAHSAWFNPFTKSAVEIKSNSSSHVVTLRSSTLVASEFITFFNYTIFFLSTAFRNIFFLLFNVSFFFVKNISLHHLRFFFSLRPSKVPNAHFKYFSQFFHTHLRINIFLFFQHHHHVCCCCCNIERNTSSHV